MGARRGGGGAKGRGAYQLFVPGWVILKGKYQAGTSESTSFCVKLGGGGEGAKGARGLPVARASRGDRGRQVPSRHLRKHCILREIGRPHVQGAVSRDLPSGKRSRAARCEVCGGYVGGAASWKLSSLPVWPAHHAGVGPVGNGSRDILRHSVQDVLHWEAWDAGWSIQLYTCMSPDGYVTLSRLGTAGLG